MYGNVGAGNGQRLLVGPRYPVQFRFWCLESRYGFPQEYYNCEKYHPDLITDLRTRLYVGLMTADSLYVIWTLYIAHPLLSALSLSAFNVAGVLFFVIFL